MSTVVIVAPMLIGSWPMISAAIAAAISTMGFVVTREAELEATAETHLRNKAEIDVEDSEIMADTTGVQEEIVVEKDGIIARFTRDERGALKVCVEGTGYTKSQLKQIGEELIGSVTQQYVYHRVISELGERNMTVVHEEVDEDRTVRIRVRNW